MLLFSDINSSEKSVEISAWCRKFCPKKHFVRQKFCPIFQYKSQVKIGQNCRNFGLVSKILSDEILSDKVFPYLNEMNHPIMLAAMKNCSDKTRLILTNQLPHPTFACLYGS